MKRYRLQTSAWCGVEHVWQARYEANALPPIENMAEGVLAGRLLGLSQTRGFRIFDTHDNRALAQWRRKSPSDPWQPVPLGAHA